MAKRYSIEQRYLDCCGRYIYNSQDDDDEDPENIFRDNDEGNFAAVNRNLNIECASIKELIKQQKIVDKSLKLKLERQQELSDEHDKKYSSSYSVSFKFGDYTTSSENNLINTRSGDTHGYRLAKIGTLGTYENIQYTCWDGIDITKLKQALKGEDVEIDEQEALALSQIVSLFVCESSRNPSTFLTAPMCLELAEKEFTSRKEKLEEKKESLSSKKNTKLGKEKIEKCDDDLEQLDADKSEIIKGFIFDYFPMVMKNATSASRHISNQINKFKNCEEFAHNYDNGRADINDADKLNERTLKLIKKWDKEENNKSKEEFFDSMNSIVSDWYDIDTEDLLGDAYDPLWS
jgi:hypothetical protein